MQTTPQFSQRLKKTIQKAHEIVNEFFEIHGLKMNSLKSIYTSISDQQPKWTPMSSGQPIEWKPPSFSFRYLGIKINFNLDWTSEQNRLSGLVFQSTRSIIANKLTLKESRAVVKNFLYPSLEYSLKFWNCSKKILEKWNSQIVNSIMKNLQCGLNIARSAFSVITDIPKLTDFATTIKISELFITLNGNQHSTETQTTQSRLEKIKQNVPEEWIRKKQNKSNRSNLLLISESSFKKFQK